MITKADRPLPPKLVYTVEDAASVLKTDALFLRDLISKGKLKYVSVCNRSVLLARDVEALGLKKPKERPQKLLYSVDDAAYVLNISRTHLYKYINNETFHMKKLFGRSMLQAEELHEYVKKSFSS